MHRLAVVALVVVLVVAAGLRGQERDLTARFAVPDGLAVTLWAESPQLFNPTAMDVDERGRIWVTEAVNYRTWNGRNPGRRHRGGDRVVILEDTDGDGVCDSTKVFAQDEDLVAPLGICVLGRRVLVSCSPRLLVFIDDDGDDVADRKEVLLDGFGGRDHDHGLHSVAVGPDGRLYFNAGNAGPHLVTDRAGWRLRSGSLYAGGGAKHAGNRPGLRSDDGRVWTGGLVLRMEPDGTGLTVLAHNFRNPYEVAVDAFGDLWQSDNDDDGNRSCRTSWVMEGGNYGYFSADGSRSWQADRRPGQTTQDAHWHQDDPGVMPSGCVNGAGGPTGVAVYEGGALPVLVPGTVLNCDAGAGVVYAHRPRAVGAGFELEKAELIRWRATPGDGGRAQWFRPSDVVVGADGAVYVSDWWDPGVGGHAAGDREAYGRILRIAPAGTAAGTATGVPFDFETLAGLLAAWDGPACSLRGRAGWALRAHGAAAVDAIRARWESGSTRARARALFWLAGDAGAGRAVVTAALQDPAPRLRVVALRALRRLDADWVEAAAVLAEDPSPAVRRAFAVALREVPFTKRLYPLLKLAAGYDGDDRTYLEAFGIGADGGEATLYPALVGSIGGQPLRWTRAFASLVWRLHPESAMPALLARAVAPELSAQQRREAVTALAFVPGRAGAEGMLSVAQAGPADARAAAAWWVMHRDGNDWREYGLANQLGASRADAELRWKSGVLTSGVAEVDVDVAGVRTLWLEVTDGGNGMSHDWADWVEPRLVTLDGEVKLTELSWLGATTGWGTVHVDRNADGGVLQLGGERPTWGIGTHAPSELVFRLPERVTRFKARVGPDVGGTSQRGSSTAVEFRVWVDAPPIARVDLAQWREQLRDAATPLAERRTAAAALASDREGAAFLLRLAAVGELDAALTAVVAEHIFANPDASVRALASQYFDRPGSRYTFPPIPELVAMPADARRGQQVYFGGKAACATCHTYKGRGVEMGPDLTGVHTKYGTAGLLDAILNPSAGISFGYEAWMIETRDGAVHFGFLLADGHNVVLKDTVGVRHVIPADQIAARQKQARSLMPDSAVLGLSAQELVDLAAFLLENASATRQLGVEVVLFNGRNLDGWTHHLPAGVDSASVWSVEDGVLTCRGQPAGYLRTERDFESYVLTVEWRFPTGGSPGNSGVLLRMVGADKVWPKSIEAQLQSGHAGDLWNIDRVGMQVSAARTKGRRTVKLEPSSEHTQGEWNRYEITLDGGDLELIVNGVVQNTATFCEVVPGKICLQSEGTVIQFRKVTLREITHAR